MTTYAASSSATGNEGEGNCRGNYPCGEVVGDISVNAEGGAADSYSHSESAAEASATSSSVSGAVSESALSSNVEVNLTQQGGSNSRTIRNVVGPDTPNVYPSAPCRIARSGGLSFPGGALSGGGSVEDVECTLRETARAFQYLGVPAVGLVLLCQNSVVITGRKSKGGEDEAGQKPMGTDECLRLVREFQGDVKDDTNYVLDVEQRVRAELQAYREEQRSTEQSLYARIDELERSASKPVPASHPRTAETRPQQIIVQQPYLSDEKKAQLRALTSQEVEE